MNRLTAALLFAGLSITAGAALAAPATPWFTADSVVTSDNELTWNLDYTIHNPGVFGFYPDSFVLERENRDPGKRRGPRIVTENLNALLATARSIAGGDSTLLTFVGPAAFDSGLLRFRMTGHTTEGPTPPLTMTVTARPGPYVRALASYLLAKGRDTVEVYDFPPSNSEGRMPGLLLVHSEEGNARDLLRTAIWFRSRGIAVVIMSLPGCGHSNGTLDFAGPRTLRALEMGLAHLSALPGVDPARLAVWGVSQSATGAALLAARHPELRALILESAYYDLQATHRTRASDALGAEIRGAAGRDSAAWQARTPLHHARGVRCAVLLLHGADDAESPVAAARDYAARLEAARTVIVSRIVERRTHALPPTTVRSAVAAFLQERFATGPAGTAKPVLQP